MSTPTKNPGITIKNLKALNRVLRRVHRARKPFDINNWFGRIHTPNQTAQDQLKCRMTACAGGHLAISPEGKVMGLTTKHYSDSLLIAIYHKDTDSTNLHALTFALNIEFSEAEYIFLPRNYYKLHPSPLTVVNHVNKVIEKYNAKSNP